MKQFEKDGVVFTDGSREGADHVILCTGYSIDLPFLKDDLRKCIQDERTNEIKVARMTRTRLCHQSFKIILIYDDLEK